MIIRSKAPGRISFAGGGTDIPPYSEERCGCVVSTTINKYIWSSLKPRNDQRIIIESYDYAKRLEFSSIDEMGYDGNLDLVKAVINEFKPESGLEIFIRSDVPPTSGLGSSASAFASVIGLFNHLNKKKMTKNEMAELAYHLETDVLKNRVGRQDQYASVFGGLNFIEFKGHGSVNVNPLKIKRDYFLELEKNLILVHVSRREKSGDIISHQMKSYQDREKSVIEGLDRTKRIAMEIKKSLIKGDLNRFGELLNEAWEAKKKFSHMISTGHINQVYELAREHGAMGGKISGAGGGGHMVLYCEPNKEHLVARTLEEVGVKVVDYAFDREGLQTWEVKE